MSMTVFELVATLGLDASSFENGLRDAGSKADSIGSTLGKGLGNVAKAGATALTAATGATMALGKSAVDSGKAFDASMAQVAATMGKPVAEIQDLRAFAQEMGATTAFSATQAADALNYMALAGYESEDAIKMLPNVLSLAAAGGMDLATASDMITDTQSALGLTFEETVAMVDQMAKTSSKTNTSVSQLGDAMLTIGATARGVKGGTQEINAVLGVLADNGIKASEGGTHLRNAIMSLQMPSNKGAEALAKLGMSYEDMYDAAGDMRALPEIFLEMQAAMGGMTQQSKDAIMSGIFNQTDLAAVNALIGTSADRWEELEEEIRNATGAAEQMAETQLDNLAGDLTLFDSALEGAQIAISDKLAPTLRGFVQLATNGISDITMGFQNGGLEGATEAFGRFLSDGIAQIMEKLPIAVEAGAQVLQALLDGLIDNIDELADGALQILTTLADLIMTNAPLLITGAAQMIAELSSGIGAALPELVPTAVEAVLTLADGLISNADMLVEGAVALAVGLGEGLINALPQMIEKVPQIIEALVLAILESIPKIAEAGGKLIGSLFNNLPQVLESLTKGVATIINTIFEAVVGGVASMVMAGINLVQGIGKGLIDGVSSVVEKAKQVAGNILGAIKGFFGINSPSVVMEKEVGQMLTLGLDKGMRDEFGALQRTTDELSGIITPEMGDVPMTGSTAGGSGRMEDILLEILAAMRQVGVTIDGRALVGQLAPYMDTELGRIYNNRIREATYA